MPTAYYNDNGTAKPIMGVTGGGSGGGVKYSDDDDTNVDRNLYVIGPGGSLPGVLQEGDVVIDARGTDLPDFLLTAGGTMSGFITLHDDPTDPMHAATKQYVDTRGYLKFIADGILNSNATSFQITDIPQTFDHLLLILVIRGTVNATSGQFNMTFNGVTSGYSGAGSIAGNAASNGATSYIGTASNMTGSSTSGNAADFWYRHEITIHNYSSATRRKTGVCHGLLYSSGAKDFNFGWQWDNTSAITSITIAAASGQVASGTTWALWGINDAS